jgi:hypothetical protein
MNGFLDHFLVAFALLAAFGYAAYALGPRALRRRTAQVVAATLTRLPAFLRLRGTAQRLAASADKASGACGGCDNCESNASSSATPSNSVTASARAAAPTRPTAGAAKSAEVKIAVSAIGRRQSTRR